MDNVSTLAPIFAMASAAMAFVIPHLLSKKGESEQDYTVLDFKKNDDLTWRLETDKENFIVSSERLAHAFPDFNAENAKNHFQVGETLTLKVDDYRALMGLLCNAVSLGDVKRPFDSVHFSREEPEGPSQP